MSGKYLTPGMVEAIEELLKSGMVHQEIADLMGVSKASVDRISAEKHQSRWGKKISPAETGEVQKYGSDPDISITDTGENVKRLPKTCGCYFKGTMTNENECAVLTVCNCDKCSFFKTEEEYMEGRKRAADRLYNMRLTPCKKHVNGVWIMTTEKF